MISKSFYKELCFLSGKKSLLLPEDPLKFFIVGTPQIEQLLVNQNFHVILNPLIHYEIAL